MKTILLTIVLLYSFVPRAQYYYNDIISTEQSNVQMKTYITNKVKTVSAAGFDQNGIPTTDFSEIQEISDNGKALKITTRNNSNNTIYYNRFDDNGRLIIIADSSSAIQSITTYKYDAQGRIIIVQNTIKDSANDFNQVEMHQWIYNSDGNPQKMWRTINNADSLEIRFTPDEDGNTGDEKTYRSGIETGVVYYYYDDKKRLSDIVRYNTKANKLLPDIMFEYDDNNRVIQKITTTSSLHLGYLIWRYLFDENGLKTKEALFNSDKILTGKIEYKYTFRQ